MPRNDLGGDDEVLEFELAGAGESAGALWRTIAWGPGWRGDGLFVSIASDELRSRTSNHVQVARSRLDAPGELCIQHCRSGYWESIFVRDETLWIDHVQPHPDGYLLVGARCSRGPQHTEQNAIVVDQHGNVCDRFTLGDGIADVRVAPTGRIFVSYFDEGVVGSGARGWDDQPLGRAGVNVFGPRGELIDGLPVGRVHVVDVYALNVAADHFWAYIYPGFEVVQVGRDAINTWQTPIRGARALSVRGDRILVVGDYKQAWDAHSLVLGERAQARVSWTRPMVFDGCAPPNGRLFGVGADLYIFSGLSFFRLQVWWR